MRSGAMVACLLMMGESLSGTDMPPSSLLDPKMVELCQRA